MNVKNKVIVVTGGGSGMGRELVLHLLSKGAGIAAIDINQKGLAPGDDPPLSLTRLALTFYSRSLHRRGNTS